MRNKNISQNYSFIVNKSPYVSEHALYAMLILRVWAWQAAAFDALLSFLVRQGIEWHTCQHAVW